MNTSDSKRKVPEGMAVEKNADNGRLLRNKGGPSKAFGQAVQDAKMRKT